MPGRGLREPEVEFLITQEEEHERSDGEDECLAPDGGDACAFDHDVFHDDVEPTRGDEVGNYPQGQGHVFDREDEAGEEHRGHHEADEGGEDGGLLRACGAGDEQPEGERRQDEEQALGDEKRDTADDGNAQHGDAQGKDHAQVDERKQQVGDELGEDEQHGRDRRDEEHFHCAVLLLANDGDGRHHDADEHQHEGDHPGDEVDGRPQLGVVEGADVEVDRRRGRGGAFGL